MRSPLADYAGQIDNSDPSGYPFGAAKNDLVAGDNSGTPFDKKWVNDWFGFFQALLAEVGDAPNLTAEKVNASQMVDALKFLAARRALLSGWKQRTAGFNVDAVAAGAGSNSIMMANTAGGQIELTTDGGETGISCSVATGGTPNASGSLVYGAGNWLMSYGTTASTAQRMCRLTSPRTFTAVSLPAAGTAAVHTHWTGTSFIATQGAVSTSAVWSSPTGATWTTQTALPSGYTVREVSANNGAGRLIGTDGSQGSANEKILITSSAGSVWTTKTVSGTSAKIFGITYDKRSGSWFATGSVGVSPVPACWVSTDGGTTWNGGSCTVNWDAGFSIVRLGRVVAWNGILVSSVFDSSPGPAAATVVSVNGMTWFPVAKAHTNPYGPMVISEEGGAICTSSLGTAVNINRIGWGL